MEIWAILAPLVKVLLYIISFLAVGTGLFILHFRSFLSKPTLAYCRKLVSKSSLIGSVIAPLLLLITAGNIGGDLQSAFDPLMINIALSSKAGQSILVIFFGFLLVLLWISPFQNQRPIPGILGFALILSSFSLYGHSTINGLSSQLLIVLHLGAISFWVGSFLPLRYSTQGKIEEENLFQLAHQFGVYAVYYIGVLLITGLMLGTILVGGIEQLVTSDYGKAFIFKLAFVTTMLGIGALNKFRLVPQLKNNNFSHAIKLRKSINIEIGILFIILIISSLLTTSIELPLK
ncbi:CopD family protein [Paracoccaceae bacterium]|nr:CopD family protein [Paracoccaceae bacterium]